MVEILIFSERSEKVIKKFNKNFDLDIWFSSIFEGRTNNFQEINYKMGSCPVAEFCSKHIVNLPTHKNISVNLIEGFIKENINWINSQKFKRKFYKMKLVILCGGLGTRFSEETKNKPKPMINIEKFPILFHIMKIYENYGITDFILAVGYKANIIKSYFKSKNLKK